MTPAHAWVATDLDRTVVFSRAASSGMSPGVAGFSPGAAGGTAEVGESPDTAGVGPATRCVELYRGAEQSFVTHRAVELYAELGRRVPVVPVTTRTIEQYRRIDLPWTPVPFAICLNGGELLVDGEPDRDWRAGVDDDVRASCAPAAEIVAPLDDWGARDWLHRTRDADGLFVYLVVDPATFPSDVVDRWGHWCAPRGWGVTRQGSKVYAMPDPVRKSRAAAEVARRLADLGSVERSAEVYAAGDGALDADLLTFADHAIRPAHGELHSMGWTCPGLVVTRATGIRAGEEIAEWFTGRIGGGPDRA